MRISLTTYEPPRVKISSSTLGKSSESMMWPWSSMSSTKDGDLPAACARLMMVYPCHFRFAYPSRGARGLHCSTLAPREVGTALATHGTSELSGRLARAAKGRHPKAD